MLSLITVYALILLALLAGEKLQPVFKGRIRDIHLPLSLFICARNEEKNIALCLQSIIVQEYPRSCMEIIFIDDASTDATLAIAEKTLKESGIHFRIFKNAQQKGKKQSLQDSIPQALHEFIITRDADTWTTNKFWLRTLADYYTETGSAVVIAPIVIADDGDVLTGLQACENQILRIFTAGSAFYGFPFLSNGANFAFTKTAFETCNGYNNHLNLLSGEDVFFLQDARNYPQLKIGFLKSENAVVYTPAQKSLAALLIQRARWASKIIKRPSGPALLLGLLNILVNSLFLYSLFAAFIYSEPVFYIFLSIKLAIDLLLLFLGPGVFEKRKRSVSLVALVLLYPLYACSVALASVLMKPRWK